MTDPLLDRLHEANEKIASLVREKEQVEIQRDQYRTDALDACGYGADHLVGLLCLHPDPTLIAGEVRALAERLEQIAQGITPVSRREIGTSQGFAAALSTVREMLDDHT